MRVSDSTRQKVLLCKAGLRMLFDHMATDAKAALLGICAPPACQFDQRIAHH
jgi:hypothetical protein